MEPISAALNANSEHAAHGIAQGPSNPRRKRLRRALYQPGAKPQVPASRHRKAPAARSIPAWGEAPGTRKPASKSASGAPYTSLGRSPRYKPTGIEKRQRRALYQPGAKPQVQARQAPRGLKARPIAISIPQIPLIELNPIFLEKRAKFLLKIHPSMMLHLPVDITNQSAQIRRPNRKCAVSSLPCKPRQSRRLSLHPFRRGGLKLLYQLRDIRLARQTNRKMNVIGNTTNPITFALGIANNRSQIGIKVRTHNVVDQFSPIFRTENYMNKQIRERLGHRDEYRSGFQPSLASGPNTWSYAPCWYSNAPSAL